MTDTEREAAINALFDLMMLASSAVERRLFYRDMALLINERSDEQVQKMEHEKGLAH